MSRQDTQTSMNGCLLPQLTVQPMMEASLEFTYILYCFAAYHLSIPLHDLDPPASDGSRRLRTETRHPARHNETWLGDEEVQCIALQRRRN
jgi:hypothetical protein